jgi:hypothetical protein
MATIYTGIVRKNGEFHIVKSDNPRIRDLLVTRSLGGDVIKGIEERQAEFIRTHCPCERYRPGEDGKCGAHFTDIFGKCFNYLRGDVRFG